MSVGPESGRNAMNSGARLAMLDAAELDGMVHTSNIGEDGPYVLMARLELYPNA